MTFPRLPSVLMMEKLRLKESLPLASNCRMNQQQHRDSNQVSLTRNLEKHPNLMFLT